MLSDTTLLHAKFVADGVRFVNKEQKMVEPRRSYATTAHKGRFIYVSGGLSEGANWRSTNLVSRFDTKTYLW